MEKKEMEHILAKKNQTVCDTTLLQVLALKRQVEAVTKIVLDLCKKELE